ncbi:YgaP family membrane protein [Methylomonas sp. BW4-1]|uniref:YgaP family membrane protein n=1 Tax=Methylomonas sp. BW4-1 TaxID=3376685 RepID=UPI004041E43D
MSIDRLVMAFAGSFVLISLALAHWHSPNWLWFTAFVGANLVQASFGGFCPLAIILKKLGLNRVARFDGLSQSAGSLPDGDSAVFCSA